MSQLAPYLRGGPSDPSGPRRGRGAAAGVAAGILATVVAAAVTEARLGIPEAVSIAVAASCLTALFVLSEWWRRPAQRVAAARRRLSRRQQLEGEVEVAAQLAAEVAARIRQALPDPESLRGRGRLRGAWEQKKTLGRYRQTCRRDSLTALAVLGPIYDVEEGVTKIAESPRDLAELYSLEVWLTTAASELRQDLPGGERT